MSGTLLIGSEDMEKLYDKLDELNTKINKKYLSPDQIIHREVDVLEILKISSSTLKIWKRNNIIKYSKIGNQVFYKHSDLIELINRYEVKKNFNKKEVSNTCMHFYLGSSK